MTSPFPDRTLRRRAAVQMGYVALLGLFVLWPNLRAAPSLVLLVATALTAIWLVGGLAAWAKVPRADELLLCGSAAPVLIGMTQLAYRFDFLRVHGSSPVRALSLIRRRDLSRSGWRNYSLSCCLELSSSGGTPAHWLRFTRAVPSQPTSARSRPRLPAKISRGARVGIRSVRKSWDCRPAAVPP